MRKLECALVIAGCATLNTGGMSPACRDEYNACLNVCERVVPTLRPGPPVDPASAPPGGVGTGYGAAQPECVDRCNRDAKTCDANERARAAAPLSNP